MHIHDTTMNHELVVEFKAVWLELFLFQFSGKSEVLAMVVFAYQNKNNPHVKLGVKESKLPWNTTHHFYDNKEIYWKVITTITIKKYVS